MRNIRREKFIRLGESCIEALAIPPENREHADLAPLISFCREMPDIGKLNLSKAKIEELCRAMVLETFPARSTVFLQGDIGEKYYIILKGKCVVKIVQPESTDVHVAQLQEAEAEAEVAVVEEKAEDAEKSDAQVEGAGDLPTEEKDSRLRSGRSRRSSFDESMQSLNFPRHRRRGSSGSVTSPAKAEPTGDESKDEDDGAHHEKLDQYAAQLKVEMLAGYNLDSKSRLETLVVPQDLQSASGLKRSASSKVSILSPEASSVEFTSPRASMTASGVTEDTATDAPLAAERSVGQLSGGAPGKVVTVLDVRHGFGEMALLGQNPRSASIEATEDMWLASVTKDSYLRIVAGGMVKSLQEKLDFMKRVPALRCLDSQVLRKLSLCFQRVMIPRGSPVYTQGEESDSVYVIHTGQCRVTTTVTEAGVPPPQHVGMGGKGPGSGPSMKKKGSGGGGGTEKGASDPALAGLKADSSHMYTHALNRKTHEVTLTVMGEGNMFGEAEILLGVPRFCTVMAESTELWLYKISSTMFLERVPGMLVESIKAESLMKASFMASRVANATEFTWERVIKEGKTAGALSPKMRGSAKSSAGRGGALPGPKFDSAGKMALAKMTLDEGLEGIEEDYSEDASENGGWQKKGGGSPSAAGAKKDHVGGPPNLSPVTRHNRQVSTARSLLRHTLRRGYDINGDPLAGTPFLGPGSPSRDQSGPAGLNAATILRSDDTVRCPVTPGGTRYKSLGNLGSPGSLTSPTSRHEAGGVGLGTSAVRSVSGVGRARGATELSGVATPKPTSQLDRWGPQELGAEKAKKVEKISPGLKGPRWSQERLGQLSDHETGGSLRHEEPEETAAKMLGLERELRVRRMRALKSMKHADVASAETFLSSWLSSQEEKGRW